MSTGRNSSNQRQYVENDAPMLDFRDFLSRCLEQGSELTQEEASMLAIEIVKRRMGLPVFPRYQLEGNVLHTKKNDIIPSLFDLAARQIGDSGLQNVESSHKCLPSLHSIRAMWNWTSFSYVDICTNWIRMDRAAFEENVDEWIMRNQEHLLTLVDAGPTTGLIQIFTDADEVLFPGSKIFEVKSSDLHIRELHRKIYPGYPLLDARRPECVAIQPTLGTFRATFAKLCPLHGLNYSNLFIAGGIVLAAMLCPRNGRQEESLAKWITSDVDIYLYGLTPLEANEKLLHIFSVFRQNLPPDAPTFVMRSSRAITFISNYPLRRIQIILTLARSPRDVLLDFDLDICCMGYDGTNVWMLPRACRALETGFNLLTMNQLHGPYLGSPQETRAPRIFKYANRGFGLRTIPLYLSAIGPNDLESSITNARNWIDAVIESGGKLTHGEIASKFHPSPDADLRFMDGIPPNKAPRNTGAKALQLLARHCALWDASCRGRIHGNIDSWGTHNIEIEAGEGYESWSYEYGPTFSVSVLKWMLDSNVGSTRGRFRKILDQAFPLRLGSNLSIQALNAIAPVIYGGTITEVLDKDIVNALDLKDDFLSFANGSIQAALDEARLPSTPPLIKPFGDRGPCFWRVNSLTMWHRFDRRVDEIHEILWGMRSPSTIPGKVGVPRMGNQLIHRFLEETGGRKGELESFKRWANYLPAV